MRIPLAELDKIRTGKITRRRSCAMKHRFTLARAERVQVKREAETGKRFKVYRCPFCELYHLATTSRGERNG